MNEKKKSIAVVLNARNEEKVIAKTLQSIFDQKLLPYRIIVINDGSTDDTKKVLSKFPTIELIDRPVRNESYLARKELANTINLGLSKLHNDERCEYVWLVGGDLIFPHEYTSEIITRMQKDSVAISSGVIEGEFSIEPRGGGRIVDWKFWKKIGMLYPVNYGWEGYLLLKANSLGYKTSSYPDLIITTQRKTGTKFNSKLYYYYGLALRALGYTTFYTLGKTLLFTKKTPKGAYYMLKGYFSNYSDLYESELRDYVKKTQNKKLKKMEYFNRFLTILKKS
ncbi:MAG: glycosyltransferase family 2 protein [Nitrosopumilus sp.]|nr:glycosyltransferase family 2 protein [Nitrosopumilus sp.]